LPLPAAACCGLSLVAWLLLLTRTVVLLHAQAIAIALSHSTLQKLHHTRRAKRQL
jgi:hypothetical protein